MSFDFFFDQDRPIAFGINVTIALMLTGSLGRLAYLYGVRLRGELTAVLKLNSRSYSSREEVEGAMSEYRTGSIVGRRFRDAERLSDHRGVIESEALYETTAEELRRRNELIRWVPGALVLLGLAGTLWGLGESISQLAFTFSADLTDDTLRRGISGTLDGAATAFSTTLAGVAASLILSFMLVLYSRAESQLLVEAERLISATLKPLYDTTEASVLGDAARHLDAVSTTLESELTGIAESLTNEGRRIETSLRSGLESIEDTFEQRAQNLLASLGRVRDATLEIIGERGPDALTLAEYVRAVQQSSGGLEKSVAATRELIPELRDTVQESIQELSKELDALLREYVSQIEILVERDRAAAVALNEATQGTAQELDRLEATLARMGQEYGRAQDAWNRADQLIERLTVELKDAVKLGLREVVDETSELSAQQASLQEGVVRALEEFQRELSQTLSVLEEQSRRSRRRAEELLGEMRATLGESVESVGVRLADRQADSLRHVVSGLRQLAREIGAAATSDGHRGTSLLEPAVERTESQEASRGAAGADGTGTRPADGSEGETSEGDQETRSRSEEDGSTDLDTLFS